MDLMDFRYSCPLFPHPPGLTHTPICSHFAEKSLAPDTNLSLYTSKQVMDAEWPLKIFAHVPVMILHILKNTDQRLNESNTHCML